MTRHAGAGLHSVAGGWSYIPRRRTEEKVLLGAATKLGLGRLWTVRIQSETKDTLGDQTRSVGYAKVPSSAQAISWAPVASTSLTF